MAKSRRGPVSPFTAGGDRDRDGDNDGDHDAGGDSSDSNNNQDDIAPRASSNSLTNSRQNSRQGRGKAGSISVSLAESAPTNANGTTNGNANGNGNGNGVSNGNRDADGRESRKRPRLGQEDAQPMGSNPMSSSNNSNLSSAACDQCRLRKIRCDRQQPECSNCSKAGIACNQTRNFKRVNHTKQLRDDFSNLLYRLDDIHDTLGTLTKLTKQFSDRSNQAPYPQPTQSRAGSGSHFGSGSHLGSHSSPKDSGDHPDSFPTPVSDQRPGSRPKSPAGLSTSDGWPSLVLPSSMSQLELESRLDGPAQSPQEHLVPDRVELENGGERTYKYPAAMTLLKSLSKKLAGSYLISDLEVNANEDRAGSDHVTATTRAMILGQLQTCPFQGKCLSPDISSDNRPIVAPPQMIARLFVDGFLRNINSRIPIFEEQGLRNALDLYYSGASHAPSSLASTPPSALPVGEHESDNPWAIIFNNIALLELGLETHVTSWQGSLAGSSSMTSLLTEDLTSSFLRNCDRALADLTPYSRPCLLHVQALLTLALAAQEFYGNVLFEKVLQTACRVSRLLGLHISKGHEGTSGDTKERERVFRVLYGMDKQRVFLTGDPCDLYHFDSDLELWKTRTDETESPNKRLISAFDDMMVVWEEIYLKLYSVRAIAAGPAYLSSQVSSLMQLLTKWNQHHPGVMDPSLAHPSFMDNMGGPGTNHNLGGYDADDVLTAQFELRYCYHVTYVLILRSDQKKDERGQMQLRRHARTCLQLIVEMGNMLGDGNLPVPSRIAKARLAALSRVLGTYPMVAIMELISYRLDECIPNRPASQHSSQSVQGEMQDIEADIDLLLTIPRFLQGLQHADRPNTYINRLRLGLGWAVQVLDETRKSWRMSPRTRDGSVMLSSAGSMIDGSTAVSTNGSASIPLFGGAVDSTGEHSPLILRQHHPSPQQQPQPQHQMRMHSTGSIEMMDMDGGLPSSTQPHMSAISGFPIGSSELGGGNAGSGIYDYGKGWPAVPFLDDLEGGGPAARAATGQGACGFHGLGFWQDFFTQDEALN
ncbi:hypothetical protein B0T19DRAFT_439739 [Cercophora scortea]|uniref:Zn(2)-C6 fungal-type domain-containing protein n=1 Tax=Cercophora scortea TaxID=314031 RepID=A0AAE0IXW7_9PEZI|nr:hypothetical protein B0T19DRAFT_439739 [Cercophora scortea]